MKVFDFCVLLTPLECRFWEGNKFAKLEIGNCRLPLFSGANEIKFTNFYREENSNVMKNDFSVRLENVYRVGGFCKQTLSWRSFAINFKNHPLRIFERSSWNLLLASRWRERRYRRRACAAQEFSFFKMPLFSLILRFMAFFGAELKRRFFSVLRKQRKTKSFWRISAELLIDASHLIVIFT